MCSVKVKPNVTPSEELVKNALQEVDITDSTGRTIQLRKPGVLAQYRLIEAIGPDCSENKVYISMVLPLIYVGAINGEIVPPISKKSHLEALIARLGDEGIKAVTDGISEHFGAKVPDGEDSDKAALKNS